MSVSASPVPSRLSLRHSLAREFFADHIKAYTKSRRKAPIYWQLATPTASYSIWLFLHDLNKDTLFRAQTDFVGPKLAHEQRQLDQLRADAGSNPNASQRKAVEAQEAFVGELQSLLSEVKRVAPLWNPTLDDGVVLTMAPLWRLVPQHKAWQKELKGKWDELAAGKYDWAHVAMHLWPERVVPKCAKTAVSPSHTALTMSFGWKEMMGSGSRDQTRPARSTNLCANGPQSQSRPH